MIQSPFSFSLEHRPPVRREWRNEGSHAGSDTGAPLVAFALAYPCAVWQSQCISNLKECVSIEASTSVITEKAAKPKRHLHWRIWLLAFFALLLGIKVAHRALQPKYQGKTAQEWFDEVSRTSSGDIFLANDPAFKGLQHLGTNAVWFLWHERAQRKSPWLATLNSQLYRLNPSSKNAPPTEQDRAHAAWVILLYFGPETGVLVPEALELLKSNDANEAAQAAMLLGRTRQQAPLIVPAILQSIVQTNRNSDQRVSHIVALKEFGPEAKAALPYLRAQLAKINVVNSYEGYWLAKAILTINGSGPEVDYFTKRLVPGDYQRSFPNLAPLEQLGTNARTAALELHKFLLTLTNEVDSARVLTVIRKIDPEGIYNQP